MKYRLNHNFGTSDAEYCNRQFGTSIDKSKLAAGSVIDLNDKAAGYLTKKYPALLEQSDTLRAVAKKPEITAPTKND